MSAYMPVVQQQSNFLCRSVHQYPRHGVLHTANVLISAGLNNQVLVVRLQVTALQTELENLKKLYDTTKSERDRVCRLGFFFLNLAEF